MITRRQFLQSSAASLALAGFPIHGVTKDLPTGNIVVIILEGGMDGLAAVPPLGDPDLERARKGLISANPITLNPFFGLHPSLGGFARMLNDGEASIVHATAFPYTKRSHFEGQNVIQTGNMTPYASKSGWLGRSLELAGLPGRAYSMDMPLLIRGEAELDNYYPAHLRGSIDPTNMLTDQLSQYHGSIIGDAFTKVGLKHEEKAKFIARDPVSLAKHAGARLSDPLGPSVAVIKVQEFDTHAGQGADTGTHYEQLAEVDDIMIALKSSLGAQFKDTVILTLTEFGRTVKMNGSTGTDHGYGSAGLLAGGLLKGGKVITQWPGLGKRDRFEERDLQSTIDYRAVCAACIEAAFGLDHDLIADKIFYTPKLERVYDHLFT